MGTYRPGLTSCCQRAGSVLRLSVIQLTGLLSTRRHLDPGDPPAGRSGSDYLDRARAGDEVVITDRGAAAGRNHDLSEADLDTAEQAWEQYWAAIRPVELTAAVERHAGTLARSHPLRGADAVHLASALAVGDPDLTLAVWDRRLHVGAATAGLPVAPAHLAASDRTSPPQSPAESKSADPRQGL